MRIVRIVQMLPHINLMIALIIIIGTIIGLNSIPFLTKRQFPKVEKRLKQAISVVTIIYLLIFLLSIDGIKLKGIYLNQALGYSLILCYLIFYGVAQPNRRKLLIVLFSIPIIILSSYTQLINQTVYEHRIHENLNLTVSREGFLACGEIIRLNKSYLGIINQELYYDSNQCLIGISRIETVETNKNSATFLLYHDGTRDSENPFKYTLEKTNMW